MDWKEGRACHKGGFGDRTPKLKALKSFSSIISEVYQVYIFWPPAFRVLKKSPFHFLMILGLRSMKNTHIDSEFISYVSDWRYNSEIIM
jgi:hypothetical protein